MGNQIKILFLSMSCKDEPYASENDIVKETWAKDIIDGKYGENVNFLLYDGWERDHQLDKENHILHIKCEDDIHNTFKKTYYAFNLIQYNYNYDFIFRTNTSTYVNVPLVLKLIEYINKTASYDQLWTADLLSLIESLAPFPLSIYGRGNGLILSRKLINIILNEGIPYLYDEIVDDIQIGKILNFYWMKNNEDYLNHLKSFGQAWFKVKNANNHHQLSNFSNENSNFEYLKNFLCIQIRKYVDRSDELDNYYEVHNSFKDKVDENIDKTLEKILEYSKNPDICIGGILGYIPLNKHQKYPKQQLYELELRFNVYFAVEKYKKVMFGFELSKF